MPTLHGHGIQGLVFATTGNCSPSDRGSAAWWSRSAIRLRVRVHATQMVEPAEAGAPGRRMPCTRIARRRGDHRDPLPGARNGPTPASPPRTGEVLRNAPGGDSAASAGSFRRSSPREAAKGDAAVSSVRGKCAREEKSNNY